MTPTHPCIICRVNPRDPEGCLWCTSPECRDAVMALSTESLNAIRLSEAVEALRESKGPVRFIYVREYDR